MNWLAKLTAALRPAPRQTVQVSCDQDGLTQTVDAQGDLTVTHMAWGEITGVFAYKRDCWSVDQIRLIIQNHEFGLEFTEDDLGFEELTQGIANHLPDTLPDWYQKVMLPPFEPCWTQVYPAQGDESSPTISS